MGENPGRITDELIKFIDDRTLNPRVRAKIVWDIMKDKDLHSWSVICFCIEYLRRAAVDLEYMKDPVSELSQLIYHQHYLFPENIGIIIKQDILDLTKNDVQPKQEKSDKSTESSGPDTSINSEIRND